MIAHIKSGSPAWIALTPDLAPGTDAATSETLEDALVHALPKAASAVLRAARTPHSDTIPYLDVICGARFYEGDTTNVPAYRKAAIRAVSAISAPDLQPIRKACLTNLRASH